MARCREGLYEVVVVVAILVDLEDAVGVNADGVADGAKALRSGRPVAVAMAELHDCDPLQMSYA
jgi:hypothetical protein